MPIVPSSRNSEGKRQSKVGRRVVRGELRAEKVKKVVKAKV